MKVKATDLIKYHIDMAHETQNGKPNLLKKKKKEKRGEKFSSGLIDRESSVGG